MGKLTRRKKKFSLAFFLCLLITCKTACAFFKKPSWFSFSQKDASFWSEMSQDFKFESDDNNPYVQRQIRWYQQHPKQLRHILRSADPFIHYVYEQTHRNHLPAELALIPLLESQYNPRVGARSGAAGLWQMMPGTAMKFGLKIHGGYDGRRDVSASTKAALTYLTHLYHYFGGNWLLALAAYDAGEGKIIAVTRRHSRSFWDLPLSHETKEYVPKLLAIASIIKQPNEYHITLPAISKQASLQEKTWDEAKEFNLSETSKDRAKRSHSLTLLMPSDQKQELTLNMADETPKYTLPPPPSIIKKNKFFRHKIKKGETLVSIAKMYGVTVKKLKQTNHLKNEKRLKIGKSILISPCQSMIPPSP
jgi:membrane-bound lytic murein transglycosylase D